jgi:hypothetical protein
MKFKEHLNLEGKHAFLSASKYHWINYDEEKISSAFLKHQAIQQGTEKHDLAAKLIKMSVKLPKTNKTFNQYVNDAIGFKMKPEQVLFYSENCFGTADAISFRSNFLQIHDLKTGESPTSMKQLLVYNALFCLEYGIKPIDIKTELRIYQSDEIVVYNPDPEEILDIMDKIIIFDKRIEQLKIGG